MTTSLRDYARAVRYRQLALREADGSRAALLNLIADEAERGVLVTSDRSHSHSSNPSLNRSTSRSNTGLAPPGEEPSPPQRFPRAW